MGVVEDLLGRSPRCEFLGHRSGEDYRKLEARCAWQAEMLERAKEFIRPLRFEESSANGYEKRKIGRSQWLADYEKGPKE